jgi:hypothetical protein
MKVNELIEKLNKEVAVLKGTKTSLQNNFHENVENIVNPILKNYNLKYSAWSIINSDNYSIELLTLTIKADILDS